MSGWNAFRLLLVGLNVFIAILAIVMMAQTGASVAANVADTVTVLAVCPLVTTLEIRIIAASVVLRLTTNPGRSNEWDLPTHASRGSAGDLHGGSGGRGGVARSIHGEWTERRRIEPKRT